MASQRNSVNKRASSIELITVNEFSTKLDETLVALNKYADELSMVINTPIGGILYYSTTQMKYFLDRRKEDEEKMDKALESLQNMKQSLQVLRNKNRFFIDTIFQAEASRSESLKRGYNAMSVRESEGSLASVSHATSQIELSNSNSTANREEIPYDLILKIQNLNTQNAITGSNIHMDVPEEPDVNESFARTATEILTKENQVSQINKENNSSNASERENKEPEERVKEKKTQISEELIVTYDEGMLKEYCAKKGSNPETACMGMQELIDERYKYTNRREQIVGIYEYLKEFGLSCQGMSFVCGLTGNTFAIQIKKYQENKVSGRPSVILDKELNEIEKIINDLVSRREPPRIATISNELAKKGISINYSTLRRKLCEDPRFKKVDVIMGDLDRVEVSYDEIKQFYDRIKILVNIPVQFVSNCDESGHHDFQNKMNGVGYVLSSMSSKETQFGVSRDGDRITLIACVNLDGSYMKPSYVITRETVDVELTQNGFLKDNVYLYFSESAFANTPIFEDWLKDVYLEEIKRRREQYQYDGYAVLLMDGFGAHLSEGVIELAVREKVIILIIPSHSSHLIQCLDVGLFGVHKRAIAAQAKDVNLSYQTNQIIKNYSSWQRIATMQNIITAFSLVGITIDTRSENGKLSNYMKVDTSKIEDDTVKSLFTNDSLEPSKSSKKLPKRVSIKQFN